MNKKNISEPIKKVMVFGTFDIFHKGHIYFLTQAQHYGNYIIVVIGKDETVKGVKGKLPKNNEKIRLNTIKKSDLASKAILGDLKDKYKVINKYKPDIICLGYDQKNFTDELRRKLNDFHLKNTKIIRLKAYKPKIYKSSLMSKEHMDITFQNRT